MADNHTRYRIEVHFTVCEGLRDKVLDEITALRRHIEKNSLDHASDIKTYVHQEPIEPKKEIQDDGKIDERPI